MSSSFIGGFFMPSKCWTASVAAAVGTAAIGGVAQQPAPQGPGAAPAGRGGGGGRGVAPGFFTALDTDKDGSVTKAEMRATFER
jgi:hypothetical protein